MEEPNVVATEDCSTECTVECGHTVLMNSDNADKSIVSCFRDKCKCPQQQIDEAHFTKFQTDIRVQNLLLQKDMDAIIANH
jgi:hypothetical protein